MAVLRAGQVLVTREQGKNGQLMDALAARGIDTYELPLIEATAAQDTDRLPAVLQAEHFDWVVLTSPEAADVFVRAWRTAGCPRVRIAVVGKGTSRVLGSASEHSALDVAFTPSKANAVHLFAELPLTRCVHRPTDEDAGTEAAARAPRVTVLYPASAKAASTLQSGLEARGFVVTRLNTYDTVPVRGVSAEDLERAKACAVVTVASPSVLKAWLGLVGQDAAYQMPLACIGSTSGNAALRAGFPPEGVYWDEDPGMDGLIRCIERALEACSVKTD